LLGVLNSKLMEFFNRNIGTSLQGGYYSYDPKIIERYPLINVDKKSQQKIISLVNQMLELQREYHDSKVSGGEKERLEQQIKNVDYEIDEEVYKLYGITEEEQKIIEESLR
ncbi:restriction endonuclease subunit R, partial [Candidatus Pacearchaeota archaeon]|nr:restriction endonuclease subunit R [Candidatus Pacearchaeota archaeon]